MLHSLCESCQYVVGCNIRVEACNVCHFSLLGPWHFSSLAKALLSRCHHLDVVRGGFRREKERSINHKTRMWRYGP